MYYPPPRSRRGCVPLLSILILLVAFGGAGYLVYSLVRQQTAKDSGGYSVASSATIAMQEHPTVVIEQCTGYVHVHGTSALTNKVKLDGSSIPEYTQSSSRNQVILQGCDLTLTVPVQTDLIITADQIDIFGVQGHMKLSANGGTITVLQSTLNGDSSIDNNGGPIRFSGALGPNSTPKLSTNGGMMSLSLAHDAIFHLKVTGIMNTITTTFPTVKAPAEPGGGDLDVDIGASPTTVLTLQVNDSPIVLTAI